MKKIALTTALALVLFAVTASAALANASIQGYVLDTTGHGVSGASVQLVQYTPTNMVIVANCKSGAAGLFNCGSHLDNRWYNATASWAVNCMLHTGGYHGWVAPGTTVVTWFVILDQVTRIC
jgi:hypothetical protein